MVLARTPCANVLALYMVRVYLQYYLALRVIVCLVFLCLYMLRLNYTVWAPKQVDSWAAYWGLPCLVSVVIV